MRKQGNGWILGWAQCQSHRLTGCCNWETEPERHWRWCCEHLNCFFSAPSAACWSGSVVLSWRWTWSSWAWMLSLGWDLLWHQQRGSSSSWFPRGAFSIVSQEARMRYRFLQIAFHLVQNSSWSLSRSACCPWNESLTTWHGRCSSRPDSCTFSACGSQTSCRKLREADTKQ